MQSLNAQSRALLMQKLDRTGSASRFISVSRIFFVLISCPASLSVAFFCSVAGSLGVPVVNGGVANQQALSMPMNGQVMVPAALPALASPLTDPIGEPSECVLLKNMFDPSTEVCNKLLHTW